MDHGEIKYYWNNDIVSLFQQTKTSITKDDKDNTLTLPNTNKPFLTADFSQIGIGCALLYMKNEGKLDVISYNCRFFGNWWKTHTQLVDR